MPNIWLEMVNSGSCSQLKATTRPNFENVSYNLRACSNFQNTVILSMPLPKKVKHPSMLPLGLVTALLIM